MNGKSGHHGGTIKLATSQLVTDQSRTGHSLQDSVMGHLCYFVFCDARDIIQHPKLPNSRSSLRCKRKKFPIIFRNLVDESARDFFCANVSMSGQTFVIKGT